MPLVSRTPEPQPAAHVDESTVRIDLHQLDQLMNIVGELGLVHANLEADIERVRRGMAGVELLRSLRDQLRIMSRRLGLFQQGLLDVRMVKLGQVFDRVRNDASVIARDLDKEVRFTFSGGDTELDKLLVQGLRNPLVHVIRNALDHGIEAPERRVALGKPRAGHISVSGHQQGNRVVIELADDGAGMDWRRIRDKALERGLLARESANTISPTEAINLIFIPGFSTRDDSNNVSGRGVGMDVLKTDIAKLSGMVEVSTELGKGSRVRIILPITLAIIQGLVIAAGGQIFCIPLNAVLESFMVQPDEIQTIGGHEVVSLRGRTLPLVHLSHAFELDRRDPHGARHEHERLYVVVIGIAQHQVGLVVDDLHGQQDVVIKPIGAALRQVPGIAGATELGDNRTVLLLDVAGLVGEAIEGPSAR